MVTGEVKVAETVTALFGIVKVHGLLETPPEHEAPDSVHLENDEPDEGEAVTEIDDPTFSEHPFGLAQEGLTVPEPERT